MCRVCVRFGRRLGKLRRARLWGDEKRGEEAPNNVDTGEGSFAMTGRKPVWDVDDDRSWEGDVAKGEREN